MLFNISFHAPVYHVYKVHNNYNAIKLNSVAEIHSSW